MDTVHFLNLEYIITRVYTLFSGIGGEISGIPRNVIITAGDISIIGMVLAVLLLIGVVYLQIRLVQVEHDGFLYLEEEKKRRQAHAEHTGVDSRWDVVVALASSSSESDWRRAILEADVMLAELLTARGYPGEGVGEQLKEANPLQFQTIDLAWEAHKMRNTLAHLGEAFPLTERDAHATIDLYRRVFEEFNLI